MQMLIYNIITVKLQTTANRKSLGILLVRKYYDLWFWTNAVNAATIVIVTRYYLIVLEK